MPEILAYFDHPVTNAYTESLNNLIRVMNRLGRGYSFGALRAKIVFAEGAFKSTNSRPKFARRVKPREVGEMLRYGVPDDLADTDVADLLVGAKRQGPGRLPKSEFNESTGRPKVYGVDISTQAYLEPAEA
jgi:transposase